MGPLRARWVKRLPSVVLLGGLLLATWPTWRVLMLSDKPTLEELMQLICSSGTRPP